jgi:hypothetical protein
MRLLAECVLSRSLAHHPRRYPGERAVWLHDDRQLHAAVLKPSPDQHCLAEPRMEPVVDPSLNQVFAGSLSPFQEGLESHEYRYSAQAGESQGSASKYGVLRAS